MAASRVLTEATLEELRFYRNFVYHRLVTGENGEVFIRIKDGAITGAGFRPQDTYIQRAAMHDEEEVIT